MCLLNHIDTGMVQAAGQFFFQLESIGAKAANLPGAVRKLGDSMVEMVEGHREIASHQADWVRSAICQGISHSFIKNIIMGSHSC